MKRIATILAAVLLMTSAYGQTDSLMLRQMQQMSLQMSQMNLQMNQMQLQMEQMQKGLEKAKEPKDIIPAKNKNTSRFYWSLQFGCFFSNDEYYTTEGSKEKLGAKFSYALKPAFGYMFNSRLSVGCKIIFADCKFSGLTPSSFKYMIANALIGGGIITSDYINWKIEPYLRYRLTNVFWKRVNLWAEVSLYGGMMIPRDSTTHQLDGANSSGQFGLNLRPMITVNLNRNLMFFSSMEFFSWNCSLKNVDGTTLMNNSITFEFIPVYTILSGLVNIGVIKRF